MLAKVQYPLDETLQNKIVIFQNTLRPYWNRQEDGETQLKDPILNEDRTYTGAIDSLVKLMSFPYPNIVEAALSFSTGIFYQLFPSSQSRLVEDGFVPLILSVAIPQALPISSHSVLHERLHGIATSCLYLVTMLLFLRLRICVFFIMTDTSSVETSLQRL